MGLGKTYSADYLIDSNGNTGVSGQVLISTATGIDWADGSAITGGPYLPLAGGTMTGTAGVIFPDNLKLNFGTGSDLQIFHNGSNSYIRDNGTGGLVLEGSTMLELKARSGETYLRGNENSSVQLYHNNNLKLTTTSTGVEVTGKITNLTAGTGNLDAVNVQQLNDATTGALIFKGTWSAASTTTSTTSAAVSSSTTVVISSSNAGISVGATVTGAALPAGVTVTAVAADEITLTISSAQSIASGATLTFTTVGGIPDLSQTARKVTGDYYICETAGVATPNGTGTAPDEWAVGDWVAFSDLATDAWQKIDNSSVLSGAGTGGTVPIWAGSGTSVTLADAPITVSGSDTTFAGIVNATNIITINSVATGNPYLDFKQGGTQKAYIQYSDTGDNLVLQSDGQMSFKTSGNTDALTIDTSQNATFAGDITATANYSAGNSKIIYKAQRSGGAVAGDWSYDDATTDMSLGTSTAHSFSLKTGNTRALTLDTSQNATFAGTVDTPQLKVYPSSSSDTSGTATIELGVGSTKYWSLRQAATAEGDLVIDRTYSSANTEAFRIVRSTGNATFAGDVTVGALTSGATAQLVINHEGGSGAVAKFMSRTNRAFIQVGDNDTNGYIVAEGDLLSIGRAASASSNNININASNNVGIGTTNPSSILDIQNVPSGGDGTILNIGLDASNPVRAKIHTESYNGAFSLYDSGNNEDVKITTSGNSYFNGGNVGIGDSGPAVKLQVSTSSPTNKVAVSIGDGWVGNDLYHKEGGLLLISGTSQDSTQTGAGLAFQTRNTQNTNYWKSSIIMDRNGAMRFTLGGAGTVQGSEDLTILSGGYVGIGITSPSTILDVRGAGATSNPATSGSTVSTGTRFRIASSTTATAVLDFGISTSGKTWLQSTDRADLSTEYPLLLNPNGGNVGIGTTDPSESLEILKDGGAIIRLHDPGNNSWKIKADSDFHIYDDSNSDYLTILNNGNVGIGTTGPTAALHVEKAISGGFAGTIYNTQATGGFGLSVRGGNSSSQDALRVQNVGGTYLLNVKGDGNVGIGTTNPGYKLHVDDDTAYGGVLIEGDNAPGLSIRDNSGTSLSKIYVQSTASSQGNLRISSDDNNTATTPTIEFIIGGSHKMRVLDNGNVGIGTTAPAARLEIEDNGTDKTQIVKITADDANPYGLVIGNDTFSTTDHEGLGFIVTNDGIGTIDARGTNAEFRIRTGATPTEAMRIDSAGAIKFNAYGAGFLQTDANGNITAGSVTTSDTLDDVTDNGNSTTNSIVLGASTVNGTMLVGGSYTSGNIVVIGGMKSSGGAMIGYAVKPDTANNHGFVSSSAFTLERSAYYQQGNRHRWYAGASQDVAIGNAVSISETMRLDFDKLGLSTTNPATLLHLGSSTNGANIISLGEAGAGGPHGLDFYGDLATRTKKFSIYYRTGTENISMETNNGTKRFEINQNGGVTFNEAFTFPTADGSAGAALVTNGSGALSWGGGYQQYSPVGWTILNNQTYTSTGANISSSSTQAQAGTTPVQRNSATEFEATKAGWYEISYSFIVKNNYTNRAMIGAYMTVSTSGGGGVISGSHSTQYVRYSTYGEYAQIQNTFYYYTSYSSTDFYLLAYLLSGSMNMTTQSISQSMISFRYINNDIT